MRATLKRPANEAGPKTLRIAAYTRKSVDDPTDQTFTSVEAQRAAIESYVEAQRSEGWALLQERYDDTGFSGATLERPAFQQLLADVKAKKVDVIAVHRFDRLSRSLLHFLQVIELFEKHDVSFISVTQPLFNTATSAGRLMLNVLMSFASYERELIGERTRDKMRAARRQGLWTGGFAPLGYDAVDKKLVVNEAEAEQVRGIFHLFIETGGSVIQAIEELDRRGWKMKEMLGRAPRGFSTTSLKRILSNVTYRGKTAPGGVLHDGAHEAIIDEVTWDQAQGLIAGRRTDQRHRRSKSEALLQGLVRCGACGSAMTTRYSSKKGRKYWYYSCLKLLKGGAAACPGSHVPARVLEAKVVEQIRALGRDPALLDEVVRQMERELEEKRPELNTRLAEVIAERERLEEESRNLASAAAEAKTGRQAFYARLGEIHVALENKEAEEAGLRAELAGLDGSAVDRQELRVRLEEFDELWEELFPGERARMMRLLVEGVACKARDGNVLLRFRQPFLLSETAGVGVHHADTP